MKRVKRDMNKKERSRIARVERSSGKWRDVCGRAGREFDIVPCVGDLVICYCEYGPESYWMGIIIDDRRIINSETGVWVRKVMKVDWSEFDDPHLHWRFAAVRVDRICGVFPDGGEALLAGWAVGLGDYLRGDDPGEVVIV